MLKRLTPKKLAITVISILLCSSGAFFVTKGLSTKKAVSSFTSGVVAGPAGIINGALVGNGSSAWVLTNTGTTSNVQLISTTSGKVSEIIPTSLNATSIAVKGQKLVAVGAGTATTGFVAFFDASTKTEMGVIATAGPVTALSPVPGTSNFYAMITTSSAKAIQVLNPLVMRLETTTIPLPSDAITFTPSADGSSIITLKSNGTVTYISTTTGLVTQTFKVGDAPIAVARSVDGTRLYVLKGAGSLNVATVDTSTEAVLRAIPAPTNTRDLAVTNDGSALVYFVGTAKYGNIQIFNLH